MTRAEFARIAQSIADDAEPKYAGLRIVVCVTDVPGDLMGVGTTTSAEDTENILQAALVAKEKRYHGGGSL